MEGGEWMCVAWMLRLFPGHHLLAVVVNGGRGGHDDASGGGDDERASGEVDWR